MFLKWPTTAPKVDCHHPQVENAEDALFQLVELWEGLEPTSPLPFDPDGEFVLLPRPGNYEYPDLNAVESLSEFALHPVPFYVYTAQHFRGYLEKKLSPFKISRKVKHENRLDSCSSPEKDFDNQQTIQKAEGDVAASSLTDTDFVEEHSTQQIERKRGWSFAFKSKKNPHQSAKELVLEENILTSNVSHSLDTPEINGSGQERAEQEQLSPVIADNSKDFSDNFGLTSVSEGEDEPDGLKIFRSSKARDSNSSKSLKSASSLETSGSWRSQISQSLFPSFAKGYFKSDSLPTDSLAPNTQPINQDSEDQSGSSGECGDSDTSLDCFPENGTGEDKTRDQEKQLEGPGQLVSHSSLSRRRGFHKTLATGFHEKILSQSLHDLVDPSSLFNVTSEEKSQQGDTSSVTNESTDESQPQTDNISFEVLKDSFQIANTVPSKGRLWPLIPFLWWRRSKADNSDVSSNRLEKRAVSLDSVFTELSSYLTQQAGEGEVVNFTNTCEKFEEFNAPGQRLYNTVDGLSRIVGMGMAEEGGNRNGGSPGGPLRSNSAYRLRSLAGKLFSSLSTNENVTNSDSRERRKLSQTTMESSDEDGEQSNVREFEPVTSSGRTLSDEFSENERSSVTSSQSVSTGSTEKKETLLLSGFRRASKRFQRYGQKSRKQKKSPASKTANESSEQGRREDELSLMSADKEDTGEGREENSNENELVAMVHDLDDQDTSGDSSVTSPMHAGEENEASEDKGKLKRLRKGTDKLLSSLKQKSQKQEMAYVEKHASLPSVMQDEKETYNVGIASSDKEGSEEFERNQQVSLEEKESTNRKLIIKDTTNHESNDCAVLTSQNTNDEKEEETRLIKLKQRSSKLRSSFKQKIRKQEKLSSNKNGNESVTQDERQTDDIPIASSSINEATKKDRQVSLEEKESSDGKFTVKDTIDNESNECAVSTSQNTSDETKEKTKLNKLKQRSSKFRSSFKQKIRKQEKLSSSENGNEFITQDEKQTDDIPKASSYIDADTEKEKKSITQHERKADDTPIASSSFNEDTEKDHRLSFTNTESFSDSPIVDEETLDDKSSHLLSKELQPNIRTFVRGAKERLSLPNLRRKKKNQSARGKAVKLPSPADWEYVDKSSLDVAANSADKGNETGEPISPSNINADERSKSSIRRAASVRLSLRRKKSAINPEEEEKENPAKSQTGRTLDIAATSDSRARAKTYRLQVDSKRLKTEWTSTQDDVESFVGTAAKSLADGFGLWKQQDQEEEKEESIITGHWENTKNHKKCQGCQASFSALALVKRVNKRDHCRKCGKVFCKGCLKYTRKLNTFAQYDPGGKEFKVCELCYKPKTVPVVEGQTHSHTKSFRDFRDEFSRYGWDKDLKDDEYRFEPTASSMLRQCKKLEKGFRDSYLQKSEQKSTNIGMMKKVVPDWQKPPTWVDPTNKDITGCQLCNQGTFLPGSLHNCRICGRRVCSSDSSTNFMLYIPNSGTVEHSTSPRPRWTVIRIVGCPPTEPAVHLYLRICFTCQDKLSNLQEKSYENMMFTLSKEYQLGMKMLQEIHSETQKMKSKIQEMMPKFLDTVENLGREPKNISETDRKSLANHQESLIDQFPKFIVSVEKLKDIRPITEQQVKLVQKVFQEKLSFYRENVATFRITGRQLMEIMPEGEIKQLQLTVNQEAINCTCLIVTQLAFEVLEISMKKKLKESESFAMIIKKVSEIIEEDLKQLMTNSEGDWEGHQKQIYGFVKSEMMEADRRLIKVNKANGVDLQTFIKQECYRKIKSTILQLEAKSSSRNFKSSKVALEKLLNECSTEK